ncbi:MAG: RidA family protein [Spirochaetales bacterium]|nr:RidA family protein [Spirochaetales bacterium]
MIIEKRLNALGLSLPEVPKSVGSYATAVLSGDMLYLSGTGGVDNGEMPVYGKLGKEVTIEMGYSSARGAVLNLLSTMKAVLGDLDRVEKIVKLLCFVNCTSDFNRQPEVANGASDLLIEIFGEEKGLHARSAIGACSLPFNIPVEIEMIVRLGV